MLLHEFLPMHCLVNLARLCFVDCENIHQILHVCIAQSFQVGKPGFYECKRLLLVTGRAPASVCAACATFCSTTVVADVSLPILISQPVKREVNRAFCPFFPIASESWSSSTEICTLFFSVSKVRFFTFAGFSASRTYSFGSELQRMISTFSLLSSRTMFLTREPRMPTHAPTGSTFLFALRTAILVR